jgi:hypothetical protein
MKVIFLDLDGVLNDNFFLLKNLKNRHTIDNGNLSEKRILSLKRIIDKTGAKIVLSSSCKSKFNNNNPKDYRKDTRAEILVKTFERLGLEIFDLTEKIDTDFSTQGWSRPYEIEKYLKDHEDIENYVILDDDDGGMKKRFGKHFIKTNCNRGGLIRCRANKAIQILNQKRED